MSTIRAAIYTRKSSDEGLDQHFNSLDAQHEACAAYIASQKHEGWVLARDRFDDGGVSGGTLDRPALQRLLIEIDAGRIRMVVVYKIDRLTRSLADFAKLVERFDAAGCSFVSVTQAFNTASSMGRLTLNVLLSFAQFEREVTAERIRDKIAASKKLGLWMGGHCPLGYDPHPDPKVRELVVNDAEALIVQELFRLYARLGSLVMVEREAARMGLSSKQRRSRSGRLQGGGALSRGQIHHVLRNPVYLGRIRHKDKTWPGRQPAIVDNDLWERVQDKLTATSGRRRGRKNEAHPAPLVGKLRDDAGDRLTPTCTMKGARRHRYYVSNRLITGGADPSGYRYSAKALEANLCLLIAAHIEQAARSHAILATPDLRVDEEVRQAAGSLVQALRRKDPDVLRDLVASGTIAASEARILLDRKALAESLGVSQDRIATSVVDFSTPVTFRRRGVEEKRVVGDFAPAPDPVLLRTLLEAHRWTAALREGAPINVVAERAGHHEPHIRTRGPLAFLSPRIQAALCNGTLPSDLMLKRILMAPIPLDWDLQEKIYGV